MRVRNSKPSVLRPSEFLGYVHSCEKVIQERFKRSKLSLGTIARAYLLFQPGKGGACNKNTET